MKKTHYNFFLEHKIRYLKQCLFQWNWTGTNAVKLKKNILLENTRGGWGGRIGEGVLLRIYPETILFVNFINNYKEMASNIELNTYWIK